jgi:hypothetical protein
MPRTQEIKALCAQLEAQGFLIEPTKNGHWKVTNPQTGQKLQISKTPGIRRTVLNAKTRLKRIGFDPRG